MMVSDLAAHLRQKGLPSGPKAEKLADLFANLLVLLEDAIGPEAVAAATAKVRKANGAAAKGHDEGEDLFAQLMKLNPEVSKEDYFDEKDGTWDVDGLKDDVQIHLEAKGQPTRGEQLFAELAALTSTANKEDYYDAESDEWDIEGLQDDITINKDAAKRAGKGAAAAAKPAAGKKPAAEDKGERLFSELLAVAPESSREDYYDAESEEWDIDGLQSDLQAVKARASASKPKASKPATAKAAGKKDADAEQMLAKLMKLSPQSSKEDYYDESAGEWDIDGLRDDLALAMKQGKPNSGIEDPERLFSQLLELAPETNKEDYYDEGADEWDIEALSEDLSITRSKLGDPQALFDELLEYHPDATKEDYYDEDAGEWDLDGLRDDLKIAKEGRGLSRTFLLDPVYREAVPA